MTRLKEKKKRKTLKAVADPPPVAAPGEPAPEVQAETSAPELQVETTLPVAPPEDTLVPPADPATVAPEPAPQITLSDRVTALAAAGAVGLCLGLAFIHTLVSDFTIDQFCGEHNIPNNVPKFLIMVGGPMLFALGAVLGAAKLSKVSPPPFVSQVTSEIARHKVPFWVLLTLLLLPKLFIVFVPAILIWSAAEWLYPRLPAPMQLRIKKKIPESWAKSPIAIELLDGVAQVRPFILFALYVFCVPIAVIWMFGHWLGQMIGLVKPAPPSAAPDADGTLSFLQNRRNLEEESETNFFHSPAFFLTALTVFACGLPAFFTYFLYQHLGIDAMLGFPSNDPHFHKQFLIIDLYIASIGCCIGVFFLRNWFTFPLNYSGEETRIEINEERIHKRVIGWFTQVLTWNAPWAGPDSLCWNEIKVIRVGQHCHRLHPLPTTVMSANSSLYKMLNSLALLIDSMSHRSNFEEFLYFQTEGYGGSQIRLRLSELNGDERARLFYALRKWAPDAVLAENVQERMIGSTVMAAPRYTQMWFDLLTDKMQRKRAGMLSAGDTLRAGSLTIDTRLASGGQANVYLAHRSDATEVVLKEFILSTSDAVGSLIESGAEFETESTLLSQLDHPRIVRMSDFFAEDRRLYIVLEKVQGESLRQRVRKDNKPLSEEETVRIALQLCEAMEYLHGQQPAIVHRDIAPDNIMIDDNGEIKLIDFSLAAAKKSRRTTSSTMGKHCYAPPEQFREQPCPQSDIYALGATMYFLLTGEDPKPITPSDVQAKKPETSSRLAEIIKRATAFDLVDRYPDVSWLKLELQDLQKRV